MPSDSESLELDSDFDFGPGHGCLWIGRQQPVAGLALACSACNQLLKPSW